MYYKLKENVYSPWRVLPQPATVAVLPTSFALVSGKHTGIMCCLNTTVLSSFTRATSLRKSVGLYCGCTCIREVSRNNSTFYMKLNLSNKLLSRNIYVGKNIRIASKEIKFKFCMEWWQFSHPRMENKFGLRETNC